MRPSTMRRAVDWLVRDRRTGRIVVAQVPNLPLVIFGVATIVDLLVDPSGTSGTIVAVVRGVALGWWALDEVVRGVNPFRRGLGAAVLAAVVAGLVRG